MLSASIRQERKHSEKMWLLIANSQASKWMHNQKSTFEPAGYKCVLSVRGKEKKTAVSFPTHLCLQCCGQHDILYANEIHCVNICCCVWAVRHQLLKHGCLKWHECNSSKMPRWSFWWKNMFTVWMSPFNGGLQEKIRWGAVAVAPNLANGDGNGIIKLKPVWGVEGNHGEHCFIAFTLILRLSFFILTLQILGIVRWYFNVILLKIEIIWGGQ